MISLRDNGSSHISQRSSCSSPGIINEKYDIESPHSKSVEYYRNVEKVIHSTAEALASESNDVQILKKIDNKLALLLEERNNESSDGSDPENLFEKRFYSTVNC